MKSRLISNIAAENEVNHQSSRVGLCSVLTESNKIQKNTFRHLGYKINLLYKRYPVSNWTSLYRK